MASADRVGVELSRKELLDAQAHVWIHILSYMNSMAPKCAIQLGIPDVIHKHGKPIKLSQLVDALPINKAKSHNLFRLLRILVHSKFFDKVKTTLSKDEEDAYCLTRDSHLLVRDEPLCLVPLALAMIDPVILDPIHHVSEWFQDEYLVPFETKNRMSFCEFQGSNSRYITLYTAAMACDADFLATILTNDCRHVFQGLKSMVDVGGGNGTTTKAIVDAFPDMKCTVLDLPHVARLEGCDNLSFVSGDMFKLVPHADAVFLKVVLHDWSDEECVKILKKCKEAISPSKGNGGKVIIVEMVLDDNKVQDHKATETKLFLDLLMMMAVTGNERTEKEWAQIFFAAGFKTYKVNHVLGLRSVIEVFP